MHDDDLAARRREALGRGARFLWDRTVDTKGVTTGFYGFVLVGGQAFPAGVHDTERHMVSAMVGIAEREL